MRILTVVVLVTVAWLAALSVVSRRADAATLPPARAESYGMRQATPPPAVDDNDDSRVGVQLVVAGIAAGVVVGLGTAAYFVRRKLGLTKYSPDQAAGGHH